MKSFLFFALFISKVVSNPSLPADEWVNKMWYICTIKYYLAIKINELMTHATVWINLENIKQSKIIQTQNEKYCMITLIGSTQNRRIQRDKKVD